jgi:hypothetical protein
MLLIIHVYIDGKKGFGGAYGIDEHAKDKSAVGFDYKAQVEKHPSQTGLRIFILINRRINIFLSYRFFKRFWW